MLKINRVGEQRRNNHGSLMTIVKYENNKNITIQFENGYLLENKNYNDFKNGKIQYPYDKVAYGVGYIGEGEYTVFIDKKHTLAYKYWYGMLMRCYDKELHEKEPTYKGCIVCEEWLNFQNFAKWFDENYYEVDGQRMQLDKDILNKGNKLYSPETCVFVPQRINNLFTKNNKKRGTYPIGVTFEDRRNKFKSSCCIYVNNKTYNKFLGRFNTPEEAFYRYKEFKEQYIKEVADQYKELIPQTLYEAMYKYKVDIID